MTFSLRYDSVGPFNNHVTRLAEALCDGFKVKFLAKMPRGVEAYCDLEKNEIALPKLDPSKLNAFEGQKLYAFSAHERKHAKLSTSAVFKKLKDILDQAKKDKKSRSTIFPLVQSIEDCRIEMNKEYSFPGDMIDLAFCRNIFCEDIKNDMEFKTKNPIGYVINVLQYNLFAKHPNYENLGLLPTIPTDNPIWQEMYNIAWDILNDGRFDKSLNAGKSNCHITMEIALDIEKAWQKLLEENPQPCPSDQSGDSKKEDGKSQGNKTQGKGKKDNKKDKNKSDSSKSESEKDEDKSEEESNEDESENKDESSSESKESSNDSENESQENSSEESDPDKLYDDVNELFDAMNKKHEMDIEEFTKMMEDMMADHGLLDRKEPSRETDPNTSPEEISRQSKYIGFNIHDREVVASPNEAVYKNVHNLIGPQIAHVRDMLAVYLRSLTQSRSIFHLRNGKMSQKHLYKTAKGIENKYIFKQTTRGEEFSVAVSLVVDLSGSMGCATGWGGDRGHLSRSGLAMQMAILLSEVFNLLEIPFEVVGFNTDQKPGYESYGYRERTNGFRHAEFINYWVFKSFNDSYTAGDTRYRLGSITGSGCNVDHEVIYWAAGRLWKRNTKRKLQIVLSDGQPSGFGGNYGGLLDSELIRVNKEIVAAGIEQFAFGLQSECVKKYYRDFMVLNNMEDLNMEALKMFANYLLIGKTK